MNVQTHMSGPGPEPGTRQVPDQMPHQSPNTQQSSGQNVNGAEDGSQRIAKARSFVMRKIFLLSRYGIFASRYSRPMSDIQKKKCVEIVKHMEDLLFRRASSVEEYMDMNTLERRLQDLTKHYSYSQRQQHNNLSSSTAMIPTPGISHPQNSNIVNVPATDASVVPTVTSQAITNSEAGCLLPAERESSMARQGDAFCSSDGFLLDKSAAKSSMASAGNHMSLVVGQRMPGQLIHSPGFIGSNSQPFAGLSNNDIFSTVESTLGMQQQQQKQYAGQISSAMHSLSSHTGNGIGSDSQHNHSNGGLYGELGLMGKSLNPVNNSGSSEGYLDTSSYHQSAKPISTQLKHHQRSLMEGDSEGMVTAELSGPRKFVTASRSVRSTMDIQDSVNLQKVPKASNVMINNQSNISSHQAARVNSNVEKIDCRSSLTTRENAIQSSQQLSFQQQPHSFHAQHQYIQQKNQLKTQSQHDKFMLDNEAPEQTKLASNLGKLVNSEPGMETRDVDRQQQVSEQFQLPEHRYQFGSAVDNSRAVRLLLTSFNQYNDGSNSENLRHTRSVQLQGASSSQNDSSSYLAAAQPETQVENKSQCQSGHVQQDFHQRISRQDEALPNKLTSEGSSANQSIVTRSTAQLSNSSGTNLRVKNLNRDQQILNQRRWLLFLNHARYCRPLEGECPEPHCIDAQRLLKHMSQCDKFPGVVPCRAPKCHETKSLLTHVKTCKNPCCPVCVPVRHLIHKNHVNCMKVYDHPNSENTSARFSADTGVEDMEILQPPSKRLKTEQTHSPVIEEEKSRVSASDKSNSRVAQNVQNQDHHHGETSMSVKAEAERMKIEAFVISAPENVITGEMDKDTTQLHNQMPYLESNKLNDHKAFVMEENSEVKTESNRPKPENVVRPTDSAEVKSGQQKINGWVSLTELFNSDQVREHIRSLRQWTGQSKSKAEKNQAMGHSMNENSCQLCGIEKLAFALPPIYCASCGLRIKRNATYYTVGAGEARQSFCIPCYNQSRGETIVVDGVKILKAKLQKKKNDEETEEWWVQCDKCETWQHQICALFNGKKNDGGQAEYTCPNCYLVEVENGERLPLPDCAVLGAKDLPKSKLSKHLEERVIKRLKEDRDERARLQGKRVEEVPSAEELVIRVVSSVDKKLEVKPQFLELFKEVNYPTEFPYKSKVVLLFQRIEGVEVCLFGMYLQEFGSECAFPNQRRVYLSYLDSVKYFRPEVKAASGEALRTFVYHEILIGYLEYCKMRGFTSCYIWACPPLKGEDYILYCHPEIQKTPKSDKLRDWYLSMLRKASKDNVVVELTNLYDHFFEQMDECRAKVTASRLPYFDGDYWPGAAEDLIYQMQQDVDGIQPNGKGSSKKSIPKRALKASGQSDLSGNALKDRLLMHKLGETISPMKEDFIMVHLQHCCKHCCVLMVSGIRWVCQQCKNFQLCDKCYRAEQNREDKERHPVNQKEKHTSFSLIQIIGVPPDTKDEDEILESEFFDTRQAFLSLCQGNHYQYDTLRRAKHSSMMILYHLHNPTAPAFVMSCNVCNQDIEAGQGWRCEVCPEYDVCNACYQREGVPKHPHKLTNIPAVDRDGQNKAARQLRMQQLRTTLDLLVHASQCRVPNCQYLNCRKVKGLFRHGMYCKVRLNGGCSLCKRMWSLLQLHARTCKESQCNVPRCADLKKHLRRLQQQSESRKRAAVNEWSRMRAAEISRNNG